MTKRKETSLSIISLEGEILKWSQKEGWRKIEGIDFISAPNGILSSNNGETIYSAIWGGAIF